MNIPHNGVHAGLVPSYGQRHRRAMQQQHTGQAGTVALVGGGVLAFIALVTVLGVAPGALIAHYGFGYKWGKSIAIGFGVMLGLGIIDKIVSPRPAAVITVPPMGGSLASQAVNQASGRGASFGGGHQSVRPFNGGEPIPNPGLHIPPNPQTPPDPPPPSTLY
jgi:hypothetical protein